MFKKIESDIVRSRESEEKFLIHVYDQMFATINRIHNSIWNMVVIIGGGVGVLNLYEKCGSPRFEIALIGYIVVLTWMLVRLLNFNRWCNRNLFIVSKIEEYFLADDVEKIYGKYRAKDTDNIQKIRTSIFLEMVFVGILLFIADCCYFYYAFCLQMKCLSMCCSVAIVIFSFSPVILRYRLCDKFIYIFKFNK